MCPSNFKPKQTPFAGRAPLFTWAGFLGLRKPGSYQGCPILHIPPPLTLFTGFLAGSVNSTNRISSLLLVPLALTSSSWTDKYGPMNVIMTKRISEGQEWMNGWAISLVQSPSTFALTNVGNDWATTEEPSQGWWLQQLCVVARRPCPLCS